MKKISKVAKPSLSSTAGVKYRRQISKGWKKRMPEKSRSEPVRKELVEGISSDVQSKESHKSELVSVSEVKTYSQENVKEEEEEEDGAVACNEGETTANDEGRVDDVAPLPTDFDIRSFHSNISDLTERFSSPKFTEVSDAYPVDDLLSIVSCVSDTIEEFKTYAVTSQKQLEDLRDKMDVVKNNIHSSIISKTLEISAPDGLESEEERDIITKLARLNAEVAKTNERVAGAMNLSAETEMAVVSAELAAEQAREKARCILEEIELKAKWEEEKRAEEQRQKELLKEKEEEEKKRATEERRAKERLWKTRKSWVGSATPPPVWETWPPHFYEITESRCEMALGCVIRGNPASFDGSGIQCEAVNHLGEWLDYGCQEELLSDIIKISHKDDNYTFEDPLYVAIPCSLPRSSVNTREHIIKMKREDNWKEIPVQEVIIDNYKDLKFVQVELKCFTSLAVMSRLKMDRLTFFKKSMTVTSSVDQRFTITTPLNAFSEKELLQLQIQPVDMGSISDMRRKDSSMKGLLCSSPIVRVQWECTSFKKPITLTLPCPPNPAKAHKMATMRALKEEKMKNPRPTSLEMEEKKEKMKGHLKQQKELYRHETAEAPRIVGKPVTRWYMGIYGNTDDDETDNLYLVAQVAGKKWAVEADVYFIQVKLDLLQFQVSKPFSKFVVLRTRSTVSQKIEVAMMAKKIEDYLGKRYTKVIVRQRNLETRVHMVTANKTEKTIRQLAEVNFENGPEVSEEAVSVREGDEIEVSFRGNLKIVSKEPVRFIFNSNLKSVAEFSVKEVNMYIEKNFPVFRGILQLFRKYVVQPNAGKNWTKPTDEDGNNYGTDEAPEFKREFLCEVLLSIPKFVTQPSVPIRATLTIGNMENAVNDETLQYLAEELNDEWKKVAYHLNVSKVRLQAIWRNTRASHASDEEAKHEMLMSWRQRVPRAANKACRFRFVDAELCESTDGEKNREIEETHTVALLRRQEETLPGEVAILKNALIQSDRLDLAEELQIRDDEFHKRLVNYS